MSLFKFLRERNPVVGALFGIEIEIEAGSDGSFQSLSDDSMNKFGRFTDDGSLRNGTEFVSKVLTASEVQELAKEYDEFLKRQSVHLTERCSTHIHVNVQDMTYEQFKSFLWLSMAIEPLLMEFTTPQRRNNTYCVPAYFATNITSHWAQLLEAWGSENRTRFATLLQNCPKYAAIGGFRLRDYGTLEFRMFPGLVSGDQLVDWAVLIESIRQTALTTPVSELLTRKVRDGVLSVLTPVIAAYRPDLDKQYVMNLLEEGIAMANDATRKPMSVKQILSVHAKLFPEEAPFVVVRGEFGQLLLSKVVGTDVSPVVQRVSKSQILSEYSGDFVQAMAVIYREMCKVDPQNDQHILRSMDIIINLKKAWGV